MFNKLNSYYANFFYVCASTLKQTHMSKRRLNYYQVRNLTYRVLQKSRAMLYRACPANHWEFRRIPIIN